MQAVTPTRLPFPPRPVRRRPEPLGDHNGCLWIILSPFILIGVGLMSVVIVRWMVLSRGTVVPVTIDDWRVSVTSKGAHSYYIKFHYPYQGVRHEDEQEVSYPEYHRAERGQQSTGKVMQLAGQIICISQVGNPATQTGWKIFYAVFWDGFLLSFLLLIAVPIARQRQLVRNGTAVTGTVTDKRIEKYKTVNCFVNYKFQASDGTEMKAQMNVPAAAYDAATVGGQVTVLYNPANPTKNIVYEFGKFEIAPLMG